MRMLLNVKFPHDEFNKAVRDGTVGQKIGRILEDAKPEAVYFTDQDGQRSAILVINLVDPSQIPAFAEPWFLTFKADVKLQVVITPGDLQKAGLEELGKKYS